jgi:hypothetical protein
MFSFGYPSVFLDLLLVTSKRTRSKAADRVLQEKYVSGFSDVSNQVDLLPAVCQIAGDDVRSCRGKECKTQGTLQWYVIASLGRHSN